LIGIRELASLLASAIVLFGSVMVPAGEEGAVAVESVGGDGSLAVADEPVAIQLDETKVYDLITSQGAPTPPANLEGGFEKITFVAAPGSAPAIAMADRDMPVEAGSAVTIEGFSGQIDVGDAGEGLTAAIEGTATSLEVDPPGTEPIDTYAGSNDTIPAAEVTLNGDLVTGSVEKGGSFANITFEILPQQDGPVPTLETDDEVLPFEQTVRVRVSDFVGLVVVAEADRDGVSLQLDGFGNVTVLGEGVDRSVHEEATVTNEEPSANFTYYPSQPQASETIHFEPDAQDALAIRSYEWDFGDGSTSEAEQPEHVYDASGTYEVQLTVTDALGRTDSKTQTLHVVNSRPIVSLQFDPEPASEGELTELDAVATDRDGEILTYDWSIPNRTKASGTSVNHTFTETGTYDVSVTVTDDEGAQASANEQLIVRNAPPGANFTVDPSDPRAREPVYLQSTASDYGDGEVVNHTWNVGSVGVREGEVVKVEFTRDGTREVQLEVRDDDGGTDRITKQIDVRNAPPDATIKISPRPLNPGSLLKFAADVTDDDPIEEAIWTFSDGVEKEGLNVGRTFQTGGAYDVTLRLQDGDGDWASFEETFYVNKAPTVELGPLNHEQTDEIAVETSELFTVDAHIEDPDGDDVSLAWNVDGVTPGQLSFCTHAPDGNESRMQCGWPDDGEHRITAFARDELGATTIASIDVIVLNQPPDLNPTVQTDVVSEGERVTFDANEGDTDGTIEEIRWFVNGEKLGVGSGFHHTFEASGTQDVRVEATDDDGAVSSDAFTVDVNAKPEAQITYDPDQPIAGESVTFTADTTDPDGDDGALTHEWRFGDGTNATGASVTHTYQFTGSYTVELTVTDEAGSTVIREQRIDVDAPALDAQLSTSPSTPTAGSAVTFEVDVEDGRQIERIDWNFGDGTTETTGENVTSTTHTYQRSQTYRLTVDIQADHGEQRRLNAGLRVAASSALDVVFEPRLPDGQCLDVDDPDVDVEAVNAQTGLTIGLGSADVNWKRNAACTLSYTFTAGTWANGDQLVVQMTAGSAEQTDVYRLGDDRPLVDRDLRLRSAPIAFEQVEVFSPGQSSQSDEEDTFAEPARPVYVTGQAVWVDGTPAVDKNVDLTVDYRTPEDRTGLAARYYDAGFSTPSSGDFVEEVPAPVASTSPSGYDAETGPSVTYLPGQYHVGLRVTSGLYGQLAQVSFVEDPAGIFEQLASVN
jgi:PKD repeat protein